MTMSYPRYRNELAARELKRFSSCLGMQEDSFLKYLTPIEKNKQTMYTLLNFYEVLDNKTANQLLHRTYNVYNAEYNTNVLRKSMQLLLQRKITFNELHEMRSTFEAFESDDYEGMPTTEHFIFRLLTLCGRSISPLQLQHQLKKMKEFADTVGRLQFYEFLEIIPLTTPMANVTVNDQLVDGRAKDEQSLYKIDDFYNFLYTKDQKVRNVLDKDYRKALQTSYFDIKYSPKIRENVQLINRENSSVLVTQSKDDYRNIKKKLTLSNSMMKISRRGREVPPQTPFVEDVDGTVELCEETKEENEPHPRLLNPIIQEKDLENQSTLMKELEWEMINNVEKYRIGVQNKIQESRVKKKFRINSNIFSHPPSTARKTADIINVKISRPSTVDGTVAATDTFDYISSYAADDDDYSIQTKSSTTVVGDDSPQPQSGVDGWRDISLDPGYQNVKNRIMQKVFALQKGEKWWGVITEAQAAQKNG